MHIHIFFSCFNTHIFIHNLTVQTSIKYSFNHKPLKGQTEKHSNKQMIESGSPIQPNLKKSTMSSHPLSYILTLKPVKN